MQSHSADLRYTAVALCMIGLSVFVDVAADVGFGQKEGHPQFSKNNAAPTGWGSWVKFSAQSEEDQKLLPTMRAHFELEASVPGFQNVSDMQMRRKRMVANQQVCSQGYGGKPWPTVGMHAGSPWYMDCCAMRNCIHIPPKDFWQRWQSKEGKVGSSFADVAHKLPSGKTFAVMGDSVAEQICRTTGCELALHDWKQVKPAATQEWNSTDNVIWNHSATAERNRRENHAFRCFAVLVVLQFLRLLASIRRARAGTCAQCF